MQCLETELPRRGDAPKWTRRGHEEVQEGTYWAAAYAGLAHNPVLAAVAVDIVDDSTGRRHLTVGA